MGIEALPRWTIGFERQRKNAKIDPVPVDCAVPDTDDGPGDDRHGVARSLASSGLEWLLRYVSALVDCGRGEESRNVCYSRSEIVFRHFFFSSPTRFCIASVDHRRRGHVYDSGDVDLFA